MLSTLTIDMSVLSILNEQKMVHQEEARREDKNARNNLRLGHYLSPIQAQTELLAGRS